MTYGVVIFSVLVQGLTLGALARRFATVSGPPRGPAGPQRA